MSTIQPTVAQPVDSDSSDSQDQDVDASTAALDAKEDWYPRHMRVDLRKLRVRAVARCLFVCVGGALVSAPPAARVGRVPPSHSETLHLCTMCV